MFHMKSYWFQGKMGIRFRIPIPPGIIEPSGAEKDDDFEEDMNDDEEEEEDENYNENRPARFFGRFRFLRRLFRPGPLDVCFIGDTTASMTQVMTEFQNRQSVDATSKCLL